MFCPKCHYEYKEEITKCPDCDVWLVKQLEVEEDEIEYKDWIQLARINSPQRAEMLIDCFRQKGIPAVLHSGAGHFGITGQLGMSSYVGIGGGFSIYIPKEYIAEADLEASAMMGDEWLACKLVDRHGNKL